jgi:hypothetical protein
MRGDKMSTIYKKIEELELALKTLRGKLARDEENPH